MGLVQTLFKYKTKNSAAVIDLVFGPNAELGNFGNMGSAISIKQAFFSYELADFLNLTVGQYNTHIGYELIEAPLNANYSLSYLFGNGPFYHTGLKLDFMLSDKVSFMVGIVNGWDQLFDFNDKKSLTAQLSLFLSDGWDLYLNWIGGDEYNGPSGFGDFSGSYTHLFDITTTYEISDNFMLGLNSAFGFYTTGSRLLIIGNPHSQNANWGGAALYLNYSFNSHIALTLRAEHFEDMGNIRYFNNLGIVNALTLTGNVHLGTGNFHIYPELRWNGSNNSFFTNENTTSRNQLTLGASFIYSL